MPDKDLLPSKGLPTAIDSEKLVLGSILLDETHFAGAAIKLKPEDFALSSHNKIFGRMQELHAAGTHIDSVTVADRLMAFGELEAAGGLSYLVSLDDGLPQIPHIDSYVAIIREKSALRRIIYLNQKAMNLAVLQEHPPSKILRDLGKAITHMELALDVEKTIRTPAEIVEGVLWAEGHFALLCARAARALAACSAFRRRSSASFAFIRFFHSASMDDVTVAMVLTWQARVGRSPPPQAPSAPPRSAHARQSGSQPVASASTPA